MFAEHGLAPDVSPMVHRAPVPVYKEGRQVGRATSITLGADDQEDGRVRLGRQALRAARHARVGRVERRGRARQGGRHRRADAVPRPRRASAARPTTSRPTADALRESGPRGLRWNRRALVAPGRCWAAASWRSSWSPRQPELRDVAAPGWSSAGADRRRRRSVARALRLRGPHDPGRRRFLALATGSAASPGARGRQAPSAGRDAQRRPPRPDPDPGRDGDATWAPSTWSWCAAPTTPAARATCSSCWRPTTARTTRRSRATCVPRDPRTQPRLASGCTSSASRSSSYAPGRRRRRPTPRARHARRHRADDRRADGLHAWPTPSGRDAVAGMHRRRTAAEGRRHVRDRRRRLERACSIGRHAWPNLKRLMGEGANFRNAITGSFPAVTACAHATIGTGAFPRQHGITGHNIRDGAKGVRKAYGERRRRRPVRHPGADARRPLERHDRRPAPGSARSATRSGTWACSVMAAAPDRPDDAAGRGLLGRGRATRLGAAQPRAVPAARDRARHGRAYEAHRAAFETRRRRPRVRPRRAERPTAAPRRSCGSRAT